MLFWGMAIFLAALVSRKIGNILTLFWMQLFGFLVGVIYSLLNFNLLSSTLTSSLIITLFFIASFQVIAYLAFYKGLEKGQVSLVSPLGASWGLITAILSIIFFKEVLKTSQLFAILLIITGIIVISVNLNDLIRHKTLKLLIGIKEG
ncbi:hypothetical protein A3J78_01980, partial [Candidatus Beckwithbacteria bacterium RBG_13_35_6]